MGTIITFIIIIAIAYAISSKNKHTPIRPVQMYQPASNFDSEENVERKVKAVDEMFNKEEFLSWTRSLFVKLQKRGPQEIGVLLEYLKQMSYLNNIKSNYKVI